MLRSAKSLLYCIGISFTVSIGLGIILLLWNPSTNFPGRSVASFKSVRQSTDVLAGMVDRRKLAIIVPFRDRFDELLIFAPYMHRFLTDQGIPHSIFIVNQANNLRFNRASLINAGFLLVREDCDYFAMHDVDLLPRNPKLRYDYPSNGAFHLASPELHPKYHYANFVGGIMLLKNKDFEKINGLSNRYWGWGQEDDEFFLRLKDSKLKVLRPVNIVTGTQDSFWHNHDPRRRRDTAKLYNQREVTRRRDLATGLHNVQFNLLRTDNLTVNGAPVTVFNVDLLCDLDETPWCKYKDAKPRSQKTKTKSR